MTPDSATRAFLDALKAAGRKPLWELTVDEMRSTIRAASLQLAAPSTDVHHVTDCTMPVPGSEIGLRIYTPRPGSADRLFPIVVHLHGAGFVAGDLDTHDSMARFYCMHADVVVIAVDYRLAPEHPFPAAVDDAYAAVEWAGEHARELHGDARRIAVLGDSAGGNPARSLASSGDTRGSLACRCTSVRYSDRNNSMSRFDRKKSPPPNSARDGYAAVKLKSTTGYSSTWRAIGGP